MTLQNSGTRLGGLLSQAPVADSPVDWWGVLPLWAKTAFGVVFAAGVLAKPLVAYIETLGAWIAKRVENRELIRAEERQAIEAELQEIRAQALLEAQVSGVRLAQRLDDALRELRRGAGALRVLLVRVENGGGVPTDPLRARYTTVVRQSPGELPPVLGWHRVPLDSPIEQQMIDQVFGNGRHLLRVEDLPADSAMRSIWLRDGVASALVCFILSAPEAWFYAAVHLGPDACCPEGNLPPAQQEGLRVGLQSLVEAIRASVTLVVRVETVL